VARGDMSAPSILLPFIAKVGLAGVCCRCSLLSMSACNLCSSCCSLMLGDEILPRNRRLGGVPRVLVWPLRFRFALRVLSDRVRFGASSCCLIDPMPSCANSTGLSKGDEANSVDDGDIKPKASAGSASLQGLRGVIANSAERGEDNASVGVAASSSLIVGAGISIERGLISDGASGSTTWSTGITWPDGSTYVDVEQMFVTARGRSSGTFSSFDHGIPEGAEEGPGLSPGSDSSSGGLAVAASPAEKGPTADCGPRGLAENGPGHSLRAELGVIGERPRSLGSKPPLARLERNSWSCMIRFYI